MFDIGNGLIAYTYREHTWFWNTFPMYPYQPREEVPIMLTKVPEKGLVLAEPQILSHYFRSQYFSVGQGRFGPPLA